MSETVPGKGGAVAIARAVRFRWVWVAAAVVAAAVAGAAAGPGASAQPDLAAAAPGAPSPSDLAAARGEGRIVVYGTMESPIFEAIQRLYRDRYGIPVEYFRLATGRLLDRVLTEVRSGRPQFDVVMANLSPMLILRREGTFGAYVSPSYAQFPLGTTDRDGILSPPYRMVVIGVVYNTRLVPPGAAPRTLADLLDERWKGRIAMPDPTQHITTAVWLANLAPILGDGYRTFVERLAGQVVLTDSFDPAMQKVASGEYPLAITYVKYVYVMGRQGAPLDYVRLDPVLAEAHHVALGAHAAHPHAARLFIDLLTSRAGLTTLAREGEFVQAPGIVPPIKDAASLHVRAMRDLDAAALAQWRRQFGGAFRH